MGKYARDWWWGVGASSQGMVVGKNTQGMGGGGGVRRGWGESTQRDGGGGGAEAHRGKMSISTQRGRAGRGGRSTHLGGKYPRGWGGSEVHNWCVCRRGKYTRGRGGGVQGVCVSGGWGVSKQRGGGGVVCVWGGGG